MILPTNSTSCKKDPDLFVSLIEIIAIKHFLRKMPYGSYQMLGINVFKQRVEFHSSTEYIHDTTIVIGSSLLLMAIAFVCY